MSARHLLGITFGPVQDFIAAARRTSDLWAGSQLLSSASRAAARSLEDQGATLVYPPSSSIRADGDVPNVVVAILEGSGDEVRSLCRAAQDAARSKLVEVGEKVLSDWPGLREDRYRAQLTDALEAYSAWVPMDAGFGPAFRSLGLAMAARKATRNFEPHRHGAKAPKNSLDGLRETVLPDKSSSILSKKLRLSKGEQLDALGVVKRHLGRQESFAALTRVASQEWLQTLDPAHLKTLIDVHEPMVNLEVVRRTKASQFSAFPYDASLLYPNRLAAERRESPDAALHLDRLQQVLNHLWKQVGQPLSYVALLLADGNRMGRYLQQVAKSNDPPGLELHGRLSQGMVNFADEARRKVTRLGGQVVYAGGDDVMALVPVHQVLNAARELDQAFQAQLASLPGDEKPNLRVGVAVAHMVEPLGNIRGWAHDEERLAKGDGSDPSRAHALSVCVYQRGGGQLRTRLSFDQTNDFDALEQWMSAYRAKRLASRLAYQIRGIAERGEQQRLSDGVVEAEFERLMLRQQKGDDGSKLDDDLALGIRTRLGELGNLRQLGTEMILARWLSARTEKDLSRGNQ
ncbi:MAG: type III-B CRISPR-associated protein Cas10/Cmr2 [bacterium]|nr:type III-B CRISPR-associated protein Cas10/Cmr2 [bacterium]